ncbi:HepT-like ribonuclease domain-containing protein [Rhodopila sp.]|uniref:HepT-like ribonuclease domain-containing protein n=1 Tax=Rhodopila sp. TaxID=2480087 RepID=UPI003D0DB3BE
MPFDAAAGRRWLDDIHHPIILAERLADGMACDALRDDLRTSYAVTRGLEIISGASRRLPDELKARHPSIHWRDMAAAGNVHRHDYEDVAVRGVWDTLRHHLPPLRIAIEQELASLGDP